MEVKLSNTNTPDVFCLKLFGQEMKTSFFGVFANNQVVLSLRFRILIPDSRQISMVIEYRKINLILLAIQFLNIVVMTSKTGTRFVCHTQYDNIYLSFIYRLLKRFSNTFRFNVCYDIRCCWSFIEFIHLSMPTKYLRARSLLEYYMNSAYARA